MSVFLESALAYHEPSIEIILIQSSFIILLNVLNWALDAVLYCGLVGQILIGIAWGTPGGQFLSSDAQDVVVQLGYLGLILLVFEGGLSTSFPSLKANMALSIGVAATGIACPIGLSFILGPLAGASNLQCFAAGAALCSTSLGTTFAVLRASGLGPTRLGVVLTSAAMLDDVAGLVMVQVISNLGSSQGGSFSAATIIRPVFVSIAFAVVAVMSAQFLVRPMTVFSNVWRATHPTFRLCKLLGLRETALALQSALLIALVTGSSYSGTSNLFAAYIAGAAISWWDSEVPHLETIADRSDQPNSQDEGTAEAAAHIRTNKPVSATDVAQQSGHSGSNIYQHYYHPAVKWVLQPMFFASIGFSIPITLMFTGSILWRGIVYAALMMLGKLFCSLWLVRIPGLTVWIKGWIRDYKFHQKNAMGPSSSSPGTDKILLQEQKNGPVQPGQDVAPSGPRPGPDESPPQATTTSGQPSANSQNSQPNPSKPLSLYPSAILGLAMVPRGEIGFLISAVAQSNGIFGGNSGSNDSKIFLITTWAIVLCTVIGPLCVGLLVRRIKRLETEAKSSAAQGENASSKGVLGVWGVQA